MNVFVVPFGLKDSGFLVPGVLLKLDLLIEAFQVGFSKSIGIQEFQNLIVNIVLERAITLTVLVFEFGDEHPLELLSLLNLL